MIDLSKLDQVKTLKQNLETTFKSPQGEESMKFLKQICAWNPTHLDPMDTNSIIARDATRRVIGTIQTIMDLSPEQIIAYIEKEL